MHANLKQLLEALRLTLPLTELEISKLDKVHSIQLALINSDFPTGPVPERVMRDVIAKPAYLEFLLEQRFSAGTMADLQPKSSRD